LDGLEPVPRTAYAGCMTNIISPFISIIRCRSTAHRLILLAILLQSSPVFAAITLSVQGKYASTSQALNTSYTRGGGGSLELDLGSYFRVGFTHQQDRTDRLSYVPRSADPAPTDYQKIQVTERSSMSSVDLSLILFATEMFVPYIFGGIALQQVATEYTIDDVYIGEQKGGGGAPTGGIGFVIRMGQRFSIRATNRWIPGERQETPYVEKSKVLDSQTTVGVSFKI